MIGSGLMWAGNIFWFRPFSCCCARVFILRNGRDVCGCLSACECVMCGYVCARLCMCVYGCVRFCDVVLPCLLSCSRRVRIRACVFGCCAFRLWLWLCWFVLLLFSMLQVLSFSNPRVRVFAIFWFPFYCAGVGFYSGRFRLGFVDEEQEFWADYDEIWIVIVMRKQNRCYPFRTYRINFGQLKRTVTIIINNNKIKWKWLKK